MHRQFSARNEDEGFTLVEVVVAMLVFAIIATGLLMTVTASLVNTRDTRARIVAANLASQEIDLIRSKNVFDIVSGTRTVSLNGDTYHVRTRWAWQTNGGETATCEAGADTSSLAYKRVSIRVTWDGMPDEDDAVFSDTAVAPRAKMNDPTLGTVLVGVIDANGVGVSGATVSVSPTNGVASVTTDSDGCAYLLKVPADTYTVSISKSGYISDRQVTTPTAVVPVEAGTTSRASFAYDLAATFRLTYADNVSGSPALPTNMTTSFLSTYGIFGVDTTTVANPKTFTRFPVSSGYSIVTGPYAEAPDNPSASCLAPDPGQWPTETGKVGIRPAEVAALPGTTVNASVPMGVVRLSSPNGSGMYITAVYVGGGSGDPGCATAIATPALMTYKYADIMSGSTATIALPYGTWKLYRGSTSGDETTQITSGITVVTTGTNTSGTIVLDPRVAG